MGENAIKMMTVGGGSSSLKVQRELSPLDGIKQRVAGKAEVVYARGYVGDASGEYNGVVTGQNLKDDRTPEELIAEAVKEARDADYVIFIGGLNKSNGQDCEDSDREGLGLSYGQDAVISALAGANKNLLEQRISIERLEQAVNIFGSFDENIRLLEQEFSVTVVNRDGELRVEGEPENTMLACKAIQALLTLSSRGEAIGEQNVRYVIGLVRAGKESQIAELTGDVLCITAKGRPVKPKTIGQKEYIASVLKNTVTIGVGPAGTGKTYLAVAAAVAAFRDKQVNRIILTRPAVEAGERLGFLPGDLQSKVDPYLRPLYDALFDMLGAETYQKYLERGNIEVAPLAYMRGRTLDDSFIILDEAQNTSREQMKMFLTRLGFGSKIVITGDVTQIDLPDGKASGLKEAMRVLRKVEGIGICELSNADVVRHVMVQRIVAAYEEYENARNGGKGRK